MKVARYDVGGIVRIDDITPPERGAADLLIKTKACALCSGELMDWYMDRKAPHVLGHEVCGTVSESYNSSFPVGSLVATHHHVACERCAECRRGAHVHCKQWKSTKIVPGGMSEQFVIPSANLPDTHIVDDLKPTDAALVEPIACVYKSVMRAMPNELKRAAVVGLGSFGLLHCLVLRKEGLHPIGIEPNASRRKWADDLGIDAVETTDEKFEYVWVCPGSESAVRSALELAAPNARIVMFAPLPPQSPIPLDFEELYFRDLQIFFSYSAGPHDIQAALFALREKAVKAEDVVSHFISLDEVPRAYAAMKRRDILKAMVVF